jgi:peptide/nickel transport system substrate-binding protein
MLRIAAGLIGALSMLAALAAPASAAKSDDTLRMAVTDWWSTLDPYQFPIEEAAVFYQTVYETLVSYDEWKHQFVPRLAKSWTQIDDRTLEFQLRDDVTFHNGDKFDADDVVATVRFNADPAVPLRHKDMYDWVENVEKTGPYTVRITAKQAFPTMLQTLAYQFYIYDSKVLNKLATKSDYGHAGLVATGPYKVTALDEQKMVLERFDGYYDKNGPNRAPIKRVIVMPIPDRQTQIAQFITGNLDILRNISADMARNLAQIPGTQITPRHHGMLLYITLDATGRSDNKAMKDQRVRKAFMMAIDRKELARNVIPGGEIADMLDGICLKAVVACDSSTSPQGFDPVQAKQLLADAGYPDGIDIELSVHAPVREIAEAIAGQLRKVGIRASVRSLPLALYVRLRGEGKLTAFVGFRPLGTQPDMSEVFDFFFNGNRDYWSDPVIKAAQKAGGHEFDLAKRTADYRRGVDQVNTMNYIYPVSDLPIVFAHKKDVRIADDPLRTIDVQVRDFFWNE